MMPTRPRESSARCDKAPGIWADAAGSVGANRQPRPQSKPMEDQLATIRGVVAGFVVAYVILDGFSLGVGSLLPPTNIETERGQMTNAIAPFWPGARPGSSSAAADCL
jgi:hypothetical protein